MLGPIPAAFAAQVIVAILRIRKQRIVAEVPLALGPALDAAIRRGASVQIALGVPPEDAVTDVRVRAAVRLDTECVSHHRDIRKGRRAVSRHDSNVAVRDHEVPQGRVRPFAHVERYGEPVRRLQDRRIAGTLDRDRLALEIEPLAVHPWTHIDRGAVVGNVNRLLNGRERRAGTATVVPIAAVDSIDVEGGLRVRYVDVHVPAVRPGPEIERLPISAYAGIF